jgi:Zn-dependent protease with chaperone function
MGRRSRLSLAGLVAAVILAPAAAFHPVMAHLYAAGAANLWAEFTHLELLAFVAVAAMSLLPAAGFTIAVIHAVRGSSCLGALVRASRPGHAAEFRYRIFPAHDVQVFTAGVLRPITFVSEGAERRLTTSQLRAALLHEEAHGRRRDVLWRLLLVAVGRALAFVPRVGELVAAATLRTECDADDYALRKGARRVDLFDAILAASSPPSVAPAAGLTDADVALRLRRLVEPGLVLPGRPAASFAALAAAVALPAVALHLAALATVLGASHMI